MKDQLKIRVILTLAALCCISGQVFRKGAQEVPTTQCLANDTEMQREKPKGRKSAAQRAMDEDTHTAVQRKGAAKRSMEGKTRDEKPIEVISQT